jgi:thiosulfate dehydrogenase
MNMQCLLFCLALSALGSAQAFDTAPHRVGDILDTAAAQALQARYEARPKQPWREPDEARIPSGVEGEQIRDGIDLMRNTSRRVGKLAPDATKRMGWNSLNCVNCHQTGPSGLPGSKRFALPLVNAVNDYPKFDAKSGKVISLEQRALGMFGAGAVPIKVDTPEFQAIMAYLRWLGRETKQGAAMDGTGLMPIEPIARAADPKRGKVLFQAKCQACHGADASGQRKPDFDVGGGYLFPPLAGDDTYDNAGHMFAVPLLARYIAASMPLGATYDKPQLTTAEALDIAAYVNDDSMPRRQNPNRAKLYPDAALRPQGYAIPEHYAGQPPEAYQRAKFGPFRNVNEHY